VLRNNCHLLNIGQHWMTTSPSLYSKPGTGDFSPTRVPCPRWPFKRSAFLRDPLWRLPQARSRPLCPATIYTSRCQLHLQQNAQAYVPRRAMLSEVADDIRTIFNAPTGLPPKPDWYKRSKSMRNLLPVWPIGWKATCQKD
jgi:hypothetical protein